MKKNNGLTSSVTKIMGYIFGVLVVCFSGYNTWELLYTSNNNLIIATLGLILFEGGLIYWWLVFQNGADGLPQMAISVLVFGLCLTGVIIANGVELGAFELSLDSHLPQQLTVGALIVQLIAKLVYPLVSPETSRKISTKILEGQLIRKAEEKLGDKMALVADDIAEKMSTIAQENLLLSIGHSAKQQVITPIAQKQDGGGAIEGETSFLE